MSLKLSAPATTAEQFRLIAAMAGAAADRLGGLDQANDEHLLQSRLRREDLHLVRWRREFPATRPGSNRAFIDFLGVDVRDNFHVVETKIGPDELLVLQGLDYWIWVQAHIDELRKVFGLGDRRPRVFIDYVVGNSPKGFVSIYTPAQAEALDGEISWQFHTVTGWRDGPPRVRTPARASAPGAVRRAGSTPRRWADHLDAHLVAWASLHDISMRSSRHVADVRSNLMPYATPIHDDLVQRGLTHGHVDHLRSSQAFALNMLAGLDPNDWQTLLNGRVPIEIAAVDDVIFEFEDLGDGLGEATHASNHRTQVDVLVRLVAPEGHRHVVLIEVKLTEPGFGVCSAWESPKNTRRTVCAGAGPFGTEPQQCFQLSNHDREHRRRYDQYLQLDAVGSDGVGCAFRAANQLMRNVALGRALVATGKADSASFALMAPLRHHSIWRHWRHHTATLGESQLTFIELPADDVLTHHTDQDAALLAERYLLHPPDLVAEAEYELVGRQALIDRVFEHGAYVIADSLDDEGNLVEDYTMTIVRLIAATTEAGEPAIINPDYPNTLTYPWPARLLPATAGTVRIEVSPLPHRRTFTNDLSAIDADTRTELSRAAAQARSSNPIPDVEVIDTSIWS